MSSLQHYDGIYKSGRSRIESRMVDIDNYLTGTLTDERRGISLIIPIKSIGKRYSDMVNNLSKIEKDQYIYPFTDLHITVFDFIQGAMDYKFDEERERFFSEIARLVLGTMPKFTITLNGITCSGGAGLIQGFDRDALIGIREETREYMKRYGLKNDERYISDSAHATFLRFLKKIDNPEKFMGFIEENRVFYFGNEEVDTIELVEHDWYNKKQKKRLIEKIQLQ